MPLPHLWLAAAISLMISLVTALPAEAAATEAPAPTASLLTPMAREIFTLSGSLPAQAVPRTVYLQRFDNATNKWRNLTAQSSADGTYSFRGQIGYTSRFQVVSPGTSDGGPYVVSRPRMIWVSPQSVTAWIRRTCPNNVCTGPAVASGFVRPVREGRTVGLYIRGSSTWSLVAKAKTDASGNFAIKFNSAGLSRWTARVFRVVAFSYASSTTASSSNISFMPGPAQLGRNVVYVDVDRGVLPTTKGADYRAYATLSRDGVVQLNRARLDRFGVRGSTTSAYTKKPYNFRFESKPPVPVFGMKADESWTLLAMFLDQSFVRDKTALGLARKLSAMTWTPRSEYVELFVNSEYRGAYLMVEKVKIDGDRVNVNRNTGVILETDGIDKPNPRYGFTTGHGINMVLKDPDHYHYNSNGSLSSDGITSSKLAGAKGQVSRLESALYGGGDYTRYLHRGSAIDFYLVKEFLKDIDGHFWRSDYISWDSASTCGVLCDRRLHFGPVWDFDRSAGNVDPDRPVNAYIRSAKGWYMNGTGISYGPNRRPTYATQWFAQLWKRPSFVRAVRARWDGVQPAFVQSFQTEVRRNQSLIGVGAYNDRARWAKEPKRYRPKGGGYPGEVQYVASWLRNRYVWMNSKLE